MPTRRLNTFWKEMSFHHKINVIGSFMMIIGLFFPWYSDLDSFRTGDVYIGLNGPLYLAGFSLLILSMGSFLFSLSSSIHWKKKKPTWLNKTWKGFHLFVGVFSFYIVFLMNSIYLHPQFGLNITSKESGFGVFMALLGSGCISIGGFLALRHTQTISQPSIEVAEEILDEQATVEQTGEQFEASQFNRKQGSLSSKQDTIPSTAHNFSTPIAADEKTINKVMATEHTSTTQTSVQSNMQSNTQANIQAETQAEKKYQPYRMDL